MFQRNRLGLIIIFIATEGCNIYLLTGLGTLNNLVVLKAYLVHWRAN